MSLLELRIDQMGFDTDAEYDDIYSFSIGHESCIIKFFKIIQDTTLLNFIKRQKGLEKHIRIVTPFVPERYLDQMKEVLQKTLAELCFADSIIIVNDFGLMNYLHRIDAARRMCLGRSLLSCFDYAPWGRRIYENETPEVQKVASQVSLYDNEKMEFFWRFQVTEAEADLTEGSVESLQKLQNAGFRISVHRTSILYGTQRSCYIRRRFPGQVCSGMECEHAEKLEPDQLWISAEYCKVPKDTCFPTLFLYGNQILGKACDSPCDWADGIIVRPEHVHKRARI